MKHEKHTLILVFAFMLSPVYAIAQPYQPITDSNASWIIQQNAPIQGEYFFHNFSLSPTKDDTVINSNTYIKIFFSFNGNTPEYYGAFRNDTNGKSYYVEKYSQQEYLLKDFSKNTGDTVVNVAYEYIYEWTWILDFCVDSVEYVISGPYAYKVMYLSTIVEDTIPEVPPFEPLVWMEKIGSFGGGILNSHGGALSSKRLYCMQDNDTIYYDSFLWWFRTDDIVYEAGECDYPVGINEFVNNDKKVQVIPNPFSRQITLKNTRK